MLLPLALGAQTFEGLQSVGAMPADLRMSYEELYQSDINRAKDYTGGRVRNKDGVSQAAWGITKMMAGGRIVYGDPITQMIERIADTLLCNYPELRSELRFYTVKSPEVNAFATAQGMVFVNVGLVAQVEDEAQLAFIIGHEVIHYYRDHAMESIVGKKKKKDEIEQQRLELDEFMRRHNRSREMETEADSLGIAMFYLRSPYAKDATDGVFDVLQYGALPFDDVPFDRQFLNTPHYHASDDCWLDSVAPITSRDDYDDSRSTHPNLLKRRLRAKEQLDGYYGGERFVTIGKDEFARLQRLARYECVRQDLIAGDPARAFYEAYLLVHMDSTDAIANRLLAQSLYVSAKFRNHGITDMMGDYNKVEGEVQQAYYMLRRIESRQLCLLAIHKLWQMAERFDDSLCTEMAKDLTRELRTKYDMRSNEFVATIPTADTTSIQNEEETKGLTKYERIKKKRTEQIKQNPNSYAFTDLMQSDPTFTDMLNKQMQQSPETVVKKPVDYGQAQLVYSPTYRVIDSKKNKLKVGRSNSRERTLLKQIEHTGKRFDLECVDFSDRSLTTMEDAESYNDFVTINEWIGEFWQTKGEFDMIRITQPAMDSLAERHEASVLNLTAAINLENTSTHNDFAFFAWILWPYAPVVIYDAIADHDHTAMIGMLIDVRQGKMISRGEYSADHNDTPTLLSSALYDLYKKADIDRTAKSSEQATKKKENLVSGIDGHRLGLLAGITPNVFKPYYRPWLGAEFAVSKDKSLAFAYSLATTSTTSLLDDETKDFDWPQTFRLSYRNYTHTNFAPLGRYWGAAAFMMKPEDENIKSTYGLGLEYGRNYAAWGRILLNIELSYNINFGGIGGHTFAESLARNFVMLNIGIGILAF